MPVATAGARMQEMTSTIQVAINGETRTVPADISLEALIEFLGLPKDRVAIEHNRGVVHRGQWAAVQLGEADRVEIVQFVGGG